MKLPSSRVDETDDFDGDAEPDEFVDEAEANDGNGGPEADRAATGGAPGDGERRGSGKFQLIPDDEFETRQPPSWLVEGILPLGAAATLVGESGAFKSFVALDMALCVTTGRSWLGTNPVKQGAAVYILAEGAGGFPKRIQAWKLWQGVNGRAGVLFLPQAVQLTRREGKDATELLGAMDGLPQAPVLIIIDTQARCTVGADEDKAKDMGLFVDAVARIRVQTGATVLTVHHTGWQKNGGRERGSSAVRAAADTVILATTGKDGTVTLTCKKQKDAAEFDPIVLRPCSVKLDDGESSLVFERADEKAADNGESAAQDGALPKKLLPRKQGEKHLAVLVLTALRRGAAPHTDLKKATTGMIPEGSFNRTSQAATQRGMLVKDPGTGLYVVPAEIEQALRVCIAERRVGTLTRRGRRLLQLRVEDLPLADDALGEATG